MDAVRCMRKTRRWIDRISIVCLRGCRGGGRLHLRGGGRGLTQSAMSSRSASSSANSRLAGGASGEPDLRRVALLAHVERLRAAHAAAMVRSPHRDGAVGRVVIGTGATACLHFLPGPLLRRLRERMPGGDHRAHRRQRRHKLIDLEAKSARPRAGDAACGPGGLRRRGADGGSAGRGDAGGEWRRAGGDPRSRRRSSPVIRSFSYESRAARPGRIVDGWFAAGGTSRGW